MENLKQLFEKHISETMYQLVASNPVKGSEVTKIKLRPILQKDQIQYQASSFIGTQVIHKNYNKTDVITLLLHQMEVTFRQLEIMTTEYTVTVLVSKKGKITVKEKRVKNSSQEIDLSHNRQKKYLLEEIEPMTVWKICWIINKDKLPFEAQIEFLKKKGYAKIIGNRDTIEELKELYSIPYPVLYYTNDLWHIAFWWI